MDDSVIHQTAPMCIPIQYWTIVTCTVPVLPPTELLSVYPVGHVWLCPGSVPFRPQNCPFMCGDLDPHVIHGSLGPSESTSQTPNGILIGSTIVAGLTIVTVSQLEFNVPFQHKYGYIRDERSGMESYPYPVKEGQRYINLNTGRLFVQQPPKKGQETQLSLRDRATRACQLKSGKVLHKCRRLVFEKV